MFELLHVFPLMCSHCITLEYVRITNGSRKKTTFYKAHAFLDAFPFD